MSFFNIFTSFLAIISLNVAQEIIQSIEVLTTTLPEPRGMWDGEYDPISGKVWLFGDSSPPQGSPARVWTFDPATEAFDTSRTSRFQPDGSNNVAIIDDMAYIKPTSLNVLRMYNLTDGTERSMTGGLSPYGSLAADKTGKQLYIIGFTANHVYDTTTQSLTQGPAMPERHFNMPALWYNDVLYALGGVQGVFDGQVIRINTVDFTSNSWVAPGNQPNVSSLGFAGSKIFLEDMGVVVIFGSYFLDTLLEIWYFDIVAETLTQSSFTLPVSHEFGAPAYVPGSLVGYLLGFENAFSAGDQITKITFNTEPSQSPSVVPTAQSTAPTLTPTSVTDVPSMLPTATTETPTQVQPDSVSPTMTPTSNDGTEECENAFSECIDNCKRRRHRCRRRCRRERRRCIRDAGGRSAFNTHERDSSDGNREKVFTIGLVSFIALFFCCFVGILMKKFVGTCKQTKVHAENELEMTTNTEISVED